MKQKGDRVGAIISASSDTKTVKFAGYGIYKGDEIPPKGIEIMGMDLHDMGHTNPRIDLDNGHTIWGCQCWWGPEDVVKHHMEAYEKEGFTINIVDPKIYSRGGVG